MGKDRDLGCGDFGSRGLRERLLRMGRRDGKEAGNQQDSRGLAEGHRHDHEWLRSGNTVPECYETRMKCPPKEESPHGGPGSFGLVWSRAVFGQTHPDTCQRTAFIAGFDKCARQADGVRLVAYGRRLCFTAQKQEIHGDTPFCEVSRRLFILYPHRVYVLKRTCAFWAGLDCNREH